MSSVKYLKRRMSSPKVEVNSRNFLLTVKLCKKSSTALLFSHPVLSALHKCIQKPCKSQMPLRFWQPVLLYRDKLHSTMHVQHTRSQKARCILSLTLLASQILKLFFLKVLNITQSRSVYPAQNLKNFQPYLKSCKNAPRSQDCSFYSNGTKGSVSASLFQSELQKLSNQEVGRWNVPEDKGTHLNGGGSVE